MNETIIKMNLKIATKLENINNDDDEIITFKLILRKLKREKKNKSHNKEKNYIETKKNCIEIKKSFLSNKKLKIEIRTKMQIKNLRIRISRR